MCLCPLAVKKVTYVLTGERMVAHGLDHRQHLTHRSAHLASAALIMQRSGCQNPKSSSPHTSLCVSQHQVQDVSLTLTFAQLLFYLHGIDFCLTGKIFFLLHLHNEVCVFAYVSSG